MYCFGPPRDSAPYSRVLSLSPQARPLMMAQKAWQLSNRSSWTWQGPPDAHDIHASTPNKPISPAVSSARDSGAGAVDQTVNTSIARRADVAKAAAAIHQPLPPQSPSSSFDGAAATPRGGAVEADESDQSPVDRLLHEVALTPLTVPSAHLGGPEKGGPGAEATAGSVSGGGQADYRPSPLPTATPLPAVKLQSAADHASAVADQGDAGRRRGALGSTSRRPLMLRGSSESPTTWHLAPQQTSVMQMQLQHHGGAMGGRQLGRRITRDSDSGWRESVLPEASWASTAEPYEEESNEEGEGENRNDEGSPAGFHPGHEALAGESQKCDDGTANAALATPTSASPSFPGYMLAGPVASATPNMTPFVPLGARRTAAVPTESDHWEQQQQHSAGPSWATLWASQGSSISAALSPSSPSRATSVASAMASALLALQLVSPSPPPDAGANDWEEEDGALSALSPPSMGSRALALPHQEGPADELLDPEVGRGKAPGAEFSFPLPGGNSRGEAAHSAVDDGATLVAEKTPSSLHIRRRDPVAPSLLGGPAASLSLNYPASGVNGLPLAEESNQATEVSGESDGGGPVRTKVMEAGQAAARPPSTPSSTLVATAAVARAMARVNHLSRENAVSVTAAQGLAGGQMEGWKRGVEGNDGILE